MPGIFRQAPGSPPDIFRVVVGPQAPPDIFRNAGGTVLSVFGRTGAVVAQAGDYAASQITNAIDLTQTYADPPWIASLAWMKITGVPSVASYQTPWTSDIDAAGHQLTGLGALAVNVGAFPGIYIVKAPDTMLVNPSTVSWETNAKVRWQVGKLNAESTGNAGSDLAFSRFDDAGNWINNPMVIFRATGVVTFYNSVGIAQASPQYPLDVSGDINTTGNVRIPTLPSTSPGAGSKKLWYDPADSNRVKYAP